MLLTIGKRMGLSLAEMNELQLRDLLDLADCYMGSDPHAARDATQEDINTFYGG